MGLEGKTIRLRALEPEDVDVMYVWENDYDVWSVSGTTAPFSRHMLERFIEEQKLDIFQTRQQRLVIETLLSKRAVGAIDIFDFDPLESRAGVGILIYDLENRGKGHATDALSILCEYAREKLRLHQLWCTVAADNEISLALFQRAGFEKTGVRRDWHCVGSRYNDEVFLQKIL